MNIANIYEDNITRLDSIDKNKYDIDKNSKVIINLNKPFISECEFNLSENSTLIINKLYKNNGINEDVTINLNGINSKVIYNLSILTDDNLNFNINIFHNNKKTTSIISNHGVVLNDAKLSFIVNSYVYKGNINSILDQKSKIITMGRNNSEIKPNLYIDEYDVVANHAASIGKFNKEDIFYLLTKGINLDDAYELLINGFLENNLNGGDKYEYE